MIIFLSQKSSVNNFGAPVDSLEHAYVRFCRELSGAPEQTILVPVANNLANTRQLLQEMKPDLIVLTGSNNVDPRSIDLPLSLPDLAPDRDATERLLITHARAHRIPILGICRGFQFINAELGGKVSFNLDNHPPGVSHECVFGQKRYRINSFHHHGIRPFDLAGQLEPLVTTPDGDIVEAYVARPQYDTRIIGVQWHPERPDGNPELFRELFIHFAGRRQK